MTTPSETFLRAHSGFLGRIPSLRQVQLYESFPGCRGVSSTELDSEAFEAVLILSLVQTYPKYQQPDPFKTILFVRGTAQTWATEELAKSARTMFDFLKDSRSVKLARVLGSLFHAVRMGNRAIAFKEPPERWTAFGFDKSDPTIPEWMQTALLEPTE